MKSKNSVHKQSNASLVLQQINKKIQAWINQLLAYHSPKHLAKILSFFPKNEFRRFMLRTGQGP